MRKSFFFVLLVSFAFEPILVAQSQDDQSPSLGDVARQARLAKQQKDAQSGNSTTPDGKDKDGQGKDKNAASDSAIPAQTAGVTYTRVSPADKDTQTSKGQNKAENSTGPSPNTSRKPMPSGKSEKKVFSNEDIAGHTAADAVPSTATTDVPQSSADIGNQATRNPPEYWTTRILAQKNAIASLKSDIDQISASIQYTGPNCVSGCAEWNENQRQKQQEVEGMKAQLQEQEKQLEDMQETARKQGYGSSVYDP